MATGSCPPLTRPPDDREIWPWEAKDAGARIVATGRGDFANQLNNSLDFPGRFRGALARSHAELQAHAAKLMREARETTRVLMREGLIAPPPAP